MNTVSDFVRWSPHSDATGQQFMTISSTAHEVKLYNVKEYNEENSSISYKEVFKKRNLSHIKCFDWSPIQSDFVAVGHSGGECNVFRMRDGSNDVNLGVRQQRPVNAVAFSSSGYLAIGLDKVRNDFCLNIWDANNLPPAASSSSTVRQPYKQLASSEMVSSIQFFRDQPDVLVTGVGNRYIRAFDLRDANRTPSLSFPSRLVHGLTIDGDQNYFASCSSDDGYMAVWDRRFAKSGGNEPVLSFGKASQSTPTIISLRACRDRNGTLGVLYGPNPPNSIPNVLKIWELGTLGDPPKEGPGGLSYFARFRERENSGVDIRPGGGLREKLFVTRSRECKRVHVEKCPQIHTYLLVIQYDADLASKGPPRAIDRQNESVALAGKGSTRATDKQNETIASFDWIFEEGSRSRYRVIALLRPLSNSGPSSGPSIVPKVYSVPAFTPTLSFGSRNNFAVSNEGTIQTLPAPSTKLSGVAEPNHIISRVDTERSRENDDSSGGENDNDANHEAVIQKPQKVYSDHPEDYLFAPADTLRIDISVQMRRRAEQGYEMNCAKNVLLVEKEEPELKEMWRWLHGAQECADEGGMVSSGMDLSYLGVYGIWRSTLPPSRVLPGFNPPDKRTFSNAVQKINEHYRRGRYIRSSRTAFPESRTAFPEQRTLGLAMCGWDFADDAALEAQLERYEKRGDIAKAAGWALFHGDIPRCIKALSRGGRQMKLMSTAVAGYHTHRMNDSSDDDTDSLGSNTWKEMCRSMSTDLDDPYSRAIFAFVTNGDWQDVLDETIGLPIRERLGIALRFLDDGELGTYIDEFTSNVVKWGEPEGILLTGITERTIDLLQEYINRTSDVQTAALVASFAVPRYFADQRVDVWVESYRELLNKWRFFHARARFDIARGKTSKDRSGNMTIETIQRQVYVRCNFCDRSIAHTSAAPGSRIRDGQQVSVPFSQASMAGFSQKATLCPNCRKPLPRCAVCLLYLGTPNYQPNQQSGRATRSGAHDDDASGDEPAREEALDRWFNFCLSCNHGTHAGHARDWFSKHTLCPVPDCDCLCGTGTRSS